MASGPADSSHRPPNPAHLRWLIAGAFFIGVLSLLAAALSNEVGWLQGAVGAGWIVFGVVWFVQWRKARPIYEEWRAKRPPGWD